MIYGTRPADRGFGDGLASWQLPVLDLAAPSASRVASIQKASVAAADTLLDSYRHEVDRW